MTTDASAVSMLMEGVAKSASQAAERYQALGVLKWAQEQAAKDTEESEKRFLSFLELSGLPSFPFSHTLKTYWKQLWLSGLFIPLAKYVTSCPLASMAGVHHDGKVEFRELPPSPSWLPVGLDPLRGLLPVAADNRILGPLRARLREKKEDKPTKRAQRLAWSFLGIKAMMPAMWVDQVAASLQEHSQLLSSEPPPLDDTQTDILACLGRSVGLAAYAPGSTMSNLPRPKLSSSAGWVKIFDQEASRFRTMAGTRAAQYVALGGRLTEELTGMSFRPSTGVVEYRSHPFQFCWSDWDFDPRVDVVALQEPFKIRTITISDGPATAAGSSLQMSWHRLMRGLVPFSLIGGTSVTDASLMFTFDDGRAFVSGDYSAATDRLSSRASRVVFDGLTSHLAIPFELRRRLEVGLFTSQLNYSRTLETFRGRVPDELLDSIPVPETTEQRNGQLMGNILSFPILCLVNLSGFLRLALDFPDHPVHRLVLRGLERGHWTLQELDSLPVLINGDDILFKATVPEYARWREIIGQLGLKLSVGKNYFSESFFTLNSEVHRADGILTRPWWGGLLTDTIRMRNELKWELGVDVLTSDFRRVCSTIQGAFLSTIPSSLRPLANSIFLDTYRPLLEPYKGLQWFLPIELGGLGLDPVDRDFDVTYAQMKLAVHASMRGLPFGLGAEGSLLSQDNERKLYQHFGVVRRAGEVVKRGDKRYVLDNRQPLSLMWTPQGFRTLLKVHPLAQNRISSTSLFSRWLDYHVDGIRISADDVRRRVTRLLHWGMKVSDRYLDAFGQLDRLPRYECLPGWDFIPV